MDLHELEYILTISEEQNITKAADKIFLTQSALNQQLLRVEKELGVPLFERSHHTMVPTFAGKIYIENAKKILAIRDETYKIISDISENQKGEISISFTPERGAKMFTEIYPVFHKIYPGITFRIYEARAKRMEQLLLEGTVRLANTALFTENGNFETIPFGSEKMILGVPRTHPLAYLAGTESWKKLPPVDLKQFENTDFIMNAKETRMNDMAEEAFHKAGFKPRILFESSSTGTIIETIKNQIAAGFFPQYYADPDIPVVYFSVGEEFCWTIGVSFRKDVYLSKPEKLLIDLMKDYHTQNR
jgi:DNA-binding transcriptional LysR family regulator